MTGQQPVVPDCVYSYNPRKLKTFNYSNLNKKKT